MFLLTQINKIGILADDDDAQRIAKNLLVQSSGMMTIAAMLWGGIYFYYNEPLAAIIPLSYSIASAFSLLLFAQTRVYHLFRFSQFSLSILLPFFLMLTLGGFIPSSGVILWSVVAPITALLFADRRQALAWMVGLVCLLILSAILESLGIVGHSNLPPGIIRTFFVLNIMGLGAFSFVLMHYFVGQKEAALALVAEERQKSDELLANILPDPIAQRLKSNDRPIADGLDNVTIMFADIVGFTEFANRRSPEKVVSLLDEIFSALDDLADQHGVEKIKTVGDAYMAASGMPTADPNHAGRIADLALDMMQYLVDLRSSGVHDVSMRIGIHSGPVVAGVIGKRKYSYDVWGDTVNVAAKLEQRGQAGHILITAQTRTALGEDYKCLPHDPIEISGHGAMAVTELVGKN